MDPFSKISTFLWLQNHSFLRKFLKTETILSNFLNFSKSCMELAYKSKEYSYERNYPGICQKIEQNSVRFGSNFWNADEYSCRK